MWELMRYPKEVMKLLLLQKYVVGQVGPKFSMKHPWMGTLGKDTGHVLVNSYYRTGFYEQSHLLWLHDDAKSRFGSPNGSTKMPY